jgi:dolichol-phosphate mannosyltransferase
MSRALVCVPTYNEADNILLLIDAILQADPSLEILVIDDASPDGTGRLVSERTLKEARVSLMSRPGKLGLGSATMAGFGYGLQHGFQRIMTMDADFSHPPERIPALIEAVDGGIDLAIGSRYVPGGAIRGWGLYRKFLSNGANLFARSLLRLRTHDCTGAFRCYGSRALSVILSRPLQSSGYSAQIELLFRCEQAGLSLQELPITFVDRRRGKSKISRQEVVLAVVTVLRLTGRPE